MFYFEQWMNKMLDLMMHFSWWLKSIRGLVFVAVSQSEWRGPSVATFRVPWTPTPSAGAEVIFQIVEKATANKVQTLEWQWQTWLPVQHGHQIIEMCPVAPFSSVFLQSIKLVHELLATASSTTKHLTAISVYTTRSPPTHPPPPPHRESMH